MIITPLPKLCRLVILGNHRDAWTFGAVDPNSGTAALLEVIVDLNYVSSSSSFITRKT